MFVKRGVSLRYQQSDGSSERWFHNHHSTTHPCRMLDMQVESHNSQDRNSAALRSGVAVVSLFVLLWIEKGYFVNRSRVVQDYPQQELLLSWCYFSEVTLNLCILCMKHIHGNVSYLEADQHRDTDHAFYTKKSQNGRFPRSYSEGLEQLECSGLTTINELNSGFTLTKFRVQMCQFDSFEWSWSEMLEFGHFWPWIA